jgi:hypothetical protein
MKHFFLGSLILSLFACNSYYNVVRHYPDEFKKMDKIVLNQYITNEEKHTLVYGAFITYEREQQVSGMSAHLYFVFQRAPISFKLEKKGFFKTNHQSFEIEPLHLSTEAQSQTTSQSSIAAIVDSTGVKTVTDESSTTNNWFQDKYKLELSPEMMQAIRNGTDLKLRFYAGPSPITLLIDGRRWRKVQQWLQ